jgi:hypothetical protein
MKSITLRAAEAAALAREGRAVIRRKVRGYQREGYEIVRASCPLGSPGEVRWVKEPYCLIDGLVCGSG